MLKTNLISNFYTKYTEKLKCWKNEIPITIIIR